MCDLTNVLFMACCSLCVCLCVTVGTFVCVPINLHHLHSCPLSVSTSASPPFISSPLHLCPSSLLLSPSLIHSLLYLFPLYPFTLLPHYIHCCFLLLSSFIHSLPHSPIFSLHITVSLSFVLHSSLCVCYSPSCLPFSFTSPLSLVHWYWTLCDQHAERLFIILVASSRSQGGVSIHLHLSLSPSIFPLWNVGSCVEQDDGEGWWKQQQTTTEVTNSHITQHQCVWIKVKRSKQLHIQ